MTLVEQLVWKMLRKIRVLLIDDRTGSLAGVGRLLEGHYECVLTRARSATEIGAALVADRYDVVFMTPVPEGEAASTVIRTLRSLRPGTPVVLIGGKSDADFVIEAASAGIVTVAQTPLNEDSLQQVFNAFRIPARSLTEPAQPFQQTAPV